MPDSTISTKGPFFDDSGRSRTVGNLTQAIEEELGQRGVNLVVGELGHVLKNPTGFYQRHIVTDRSKSVRTVNDSGVVYGPWLEGVGSRNNTSRFKGYATFRRMVQRLNGEAVDAAQAPLVRAVGRLQ